MRLPSRKTLVTACDELVSKIVRSKGKCENCGGNEYLQPAHIYSRKNYSVRWYFENLLCFCARCHFWAHERPIEFGEFVLKHLGKERYDALKLKANAVQIWKNFELMDLREKLKRIWAAIQNGGKYEDYRSAETNQGPQA